MASSADVQALQQQLATLDARVAALPADQTEKLGGDISALKTELDGLKQQLAGIATTDDLASLRTDLTQLKQNPPPPQPPGVLEQVYFGASSTSIADAEMSKLEALATRLKADRQELQIVGFTDSQGPAEYNRGVSLRRAAAVRRALIGFGVDPSAVTSISGMGEDAPPIDTGDDTEEAGNRVVQIYGYK